MRLLQKVVLGPLVVLLALPSPSSAQSAHVVDPAVLAAAVDQHAAKQDADRAAIREALQRPLVRDTATRMGIDLDRVNASVATLAGADLERAADTARQVNRSFVGGASTVVISTTTIIIVLLLLILLVVIIKS